MSSILERETVNAKHTSVGQTPIDRGDAVQRIRPGSGSPARDNI